tara:strand:+ start:1628 stop:2431 length:804 start_codon:yes stop_codon:yes gene_type:complete
MKTEIASVQGDFFELLLRSGYQWSKTLDCNIEKDHPVIPKGTTVLAFHFDQGALIAGDRRATAGNNIMYERCDKVIPIDEYSLMAIAGVPATAFEMARVLSHNFEYYRRSQLQPLSAEGKIRALSRLLKENAGLAMQGVGVVSPLFALYDVIEDKPAIYFYDILGASFRIVDYTATGSGSPMIRGVMEYENLWGSKPLNKRNLNEAAQLAIRLLHTASQFDTATGQARPEENLFPIVSTVTKEGYRFMDDTELSDLFRESMKRSTNV